MQRLFVPRTAGNQRGAVAIMVGLSLFMFVGFAALAIDIGNLLVARNELQNAADAGALAGARFLYNSDGNVNKEANKIARAAAMANMSQNLKVEVNPGSEDNGGDVQRGHYSFATETFTPNNSLLPTDLWDVSEAELDADTNFINAIRVVTRREAPPVTAFFAGIFGRANFEASAEAVAYIGFAGNLLPEDVDQPLAICKEAILVDDKYSCNIGRMINSGPNSGTSFTGGWTSFDQNNPCSGGTNASELKQLVDCESSGNPYSIVLGEDVATLGGQAQSVFSDLYSCWEDRRDAEDPQPWEMTLLVIDCSDGKNTGPCNKTVGAVTLNIIWMVDQDNKINDDAPVKMSDWEMSKEKEPSGQKRWDNFVEYFQLKNLNESGDGLVPAPYAQKSIYFLPDCEVHVPRGSTGGDNFGILAAIPVLVR